MKEEETQRMSDHEWRMYTLYMLCVIAQRMPTYRVADRDDHTVSKIKTLTIPQTPMYTSDNVVEED